MAEQGSGGPFDHILKPGGKASAPKGRERSPAPAPAPKGRPRPSPPPPGKGGTTPSPGAPPPRRPQRAAPDGVGGGPLAWVRTENTSYLVGGAIILFAFLLWVLFLPPFSVVGDGGDKGFDLGSGIRAVPQDKLPDVPEGLTPLSQFFEIRAPNDVLVDSVTIDLNQRTEDAANVGFYTYESGEWRHLQNAELTNNGEAARASIGGLPKNLAVMRNVNFGFVVAGWLPSSGEVESEAVSILKVLNPIDYHPAPDGSVAGIPMKVTNAGTFAIVPTISAEAPAEIDALNTIIRSPQLTSSHVDAIVKLVNEGGYAGIDLDYRRLESSLGSRFTEFVALLGGKLHERQKTLSVTLPLPVRDANSWDTGPFSWKDIGAAVDHIKVPAISDQSIYAARMDDVLQFATGQTSPAKLLLVISPYSYVQRGDDIQPVQLAEALALATDAHIEGDAAPVAGSTITVVGTNLDRQRNASGIHWDDEATATAFAFEENGRPVTVWLENQYSVAFKLQLVRKHKLGGVAVLDVSASPLKANIWPPIRSVVQGGSIRLLKPNGQMLTPALEIKGPDGQPAPANTLDGGANGSVQWRIPDETGPYEVTLIVSDGVIRVGRKFRVDVTPGRGGAQPTATATPPR